MGSPEAAFKGTPSETSRHRLEQNALPTETIPIAMIVLFAALG